MQIHVTQHQGARLIELHTPGLGPALIASLPTITLSEREVLAASSVKVQQPAQPVVGTVQQRQGMQPAGGQGEEGSAPTAPATRAFANPISAGCPVCLEVRGMGLPVLEKFARAFALAREHVIPSRWGIQSPDGGMVACLDTGAY